MKNSFEENTIVLIQYPFTDLSNSKVRPALVVRYQIDQDIIVLPITSSFGIGQRDLEIKGDLTVGFKFPIQSFIRIEKICTLQSGLVKKSLGKLQRNFYKKVQKSLIEFLTGS